jgi:DNA-binding LacI/PurR family transcriptional regulator
MANIREVAKEANVSPSTVSRVLRGNVPVSKATRERIQQAVDKLRYNQQKQDVNGLQIGIILSSISASDIPNHPTLYSIITRFIEEMNKKSIQNTILVLEDANPSNIEKLLHSRMDGYLVLGMSQEQEDALIYRLILQSIPYVVVNRWMNEKNINHVNIDDVAASISATNHLISLKHRKIAFVGGDENFRNTRLRLKGFRTSCENAGIVIPDTYIFQGKYTEASGYEAAKLLLGLEDPPTAAFFSSDILAIGFLRALREKGIATPQDFSLIGFGDINIAQYSSPPLTTISIPVDEMGYQAAQVIINLINHPKVSVIQILLKASLVIRDSCDMNIR